MLHTLPTCLHSTLCSNGIRFRSEARRGQPSLREHAFCFAGDYRTPASRVNTVHRPIVGGVVTHRVLQQSADVCGGGSFNDAVVVQAAVVDEVVVYFRRRPSACRGLHVLRMLCVEGWVTLCTPLVFLLAS